MRWPHARAVLLSLAAACSRPSAPDVDAKPAQRSPSDPNARALSIVRGFKHCLEGTECSKEEAADLSAVPIAAARMELPSVAAECRKSLFELAKTRFCGQLSSEDLKSTLWGLTEVEKCLAAPESERAACVAKLGGTSSMRRAECLTDAGKVGSFANEEQNNEPIRGYPWAIRVESVQHVALGVCLSAKEGAKAQAVLVMGPNDDVEP